MFKYFLVCWVINTGRSIFQPTVLSHRSSISVVFICTFFGSTHVLNDFGAGEVSFSTKVHENTLILSFI